MCLAKLQLCHDPWKLAVGPFLQSKSSRLLELSIHFRNRVCPFYLKWLLIVDYRIVNNRWNSHVSNDLLRMIFSGSRDLASRNFYPGTSIRKLPNGMCHLRIGIFFKKHFGPKWTLYSMTTKIQQARHVRIGFEHHDWQLDISSLFFCFSTDVVLLQVPTVDIS